MSQSIIGGYLHVNVNYLCHFCLKPNVCYSVYRPATLRGAPPASSSSRCGRSSRTGGRTWGSTSPRWTWRSNPVGLSLSSSPSSSSLTRSSRTTECGLRVRSPRWRRDWWHGAVKTWAVLHQPPLRWSLLGPVPQIDMLGLVCDTRPASERAVFIVFINIRYGSKPCQLSHKLHCRLMIQAKSTN